MAYLSTVKSSSTNEILSYHLSNNLKLDILTRTIDKLLKHHPVLEKDAFIHPDQGVIILVINFKIC